MPHWTGPLPRTQAKLARAEQMLDDGCSYREIHRTLGIHVRSLREAFPNRGWTQSEGGKLAMAMRKAEGKDFKFGMETVERHVSHVDKREYDREYQATKRAQMTPEQRSEVRKTNDAAYRDAHRADRQEADRNRYLTS